MSCIHRWIQCQQVFTAGTFMEPTGGLILLWFQLLTAICAGPQEMHKYSSRCFLRLTGGGLSSRGSTDADYSFST